MNGELNMTEVWAVTATTVAVSCFICFGVLPALIGLGAVLVAGAATELIP